MCIHYVDRYFHTLAITKQIVQMSESYEQYIMEPISRKTTFALEIAFRMYALEISKYENFNIQYILLGRT